MATQRRYGVPASVTIAQAIDESGWGQSILATQDHNLFGIKGSGPAGSDLQPTQEFIGGQLVGSTAPFRMYYNIGQSIEAHGKLLARSDYFTNAMANKHQPNAFAAALTGIYATDPSYGVKLVGLMQRYDLYRFDAAAQTHGGARAATGAAAIPGITGHANPAHDNAAGPAPQIQPSRPAQHGSLPGPPAASRPHVTARPPPDPAPNPAPGRTPSPAPTAQAAPAPRAHARYRARHWPDVGLPAAWRNRHRACHCGDARSPAARYAQHRAKRRNDGRRAAAAPKHPGEPSTGRFTPGHDAQLRQRAHDGWRPAAARPGTGSGLALYPPGKAWSGPGRAADSRPSGGCGVHARRAPRAHPGLRAGVRGWPWWAAGPAQRPASNRGPGHHGR